MKRFGRVVDDDVAVPTFRFSDVSKWRHQRRDFLGSVETYFLNLCVVCLSAPNVRLRHEHLTSCCCRSNCCFSRTWCPRVWDFSERHQELEVRPFSASKKKNQNSFKFEHVWTRFLTFLRKKNNSNLQKSSSSFYDCDDSRVNNDNNAVILALVTRGGPVALDPSGPKMNPGSGGSSGQGPHHGPEWSNRAGLPGQDLFFISRIFFKHLWF